jgi:2,4-dichlorophenol 6-monooxygenase
LSSSLLVSEIVVIVLSSDSIKHGDAIADGVPSICVIHRDGIGIGEDIFMADITTDVLIIGTGPAGSSMAALLSTYGVENMVINRYRWLANTPRAHITNQRTMEVLRDLGPVVEGEAYMHATEKELMGENVFCTSLAGEEIGRLKTWGTAPNSAAEHLLSSPCFMNDLPQTFMEPLLFKTACSRGTQARMSTEYLRHEQDGEGVTTTCLDRLTGKEFTVRSKYLYGADGGNSLVADHAGLEFEGQMGVAGSINLLFKADLSKYVAHRPSVLYWVLQPGSNVGGIGMGVVRMIRPWNEWLAIWGYDINEPAPEVSDDFAKKTIRGLVGDDDLEIDITSVSTWTVNNMYATTNSNGRVFCGGDATHRHPPSNGLGSNTSIQDSFNLAWKLAAVLNGQADTGLLNSYQEERAPIAKQIVTRANQSIDEFGPIFGALGLLDSIDPVKMQANMDARCDDTSQAEEQRKAIADAIAFKKYEFDCHGVEMNQRYQSDAIVGDGTDEPEFAMDSELHYHPTTWPGARLPHVWLFDSEGNTASTLDLCGQGKFTVLTGIGGDGWEAAAARVGEELGIEITCHKIGPRQQWQDFAGDWGRNREVRDGGIVLVRPDQHVAWRRDSACDDAASAIEELRKVMKYILAL